MTILEFLLHNPTWPFELTQDICTSHGCHNHAVKQWFLSISVWAPFPRTTVCLELPGSYVTTGNRKLHHCGTRASPCLLGSKSYEMSSQERSLSGPFQDGGAQCQIPRWRHPVFHKPPEVVTPPGFPDPCFENHC